MGPNRVFISTMAALAPLLEKEAAIAGAKTIFQTASETDVTGPRGFTLEEQQELLDSIARMDVVAVQTRTQQENLFGTRSRDSIVIRKGMPAPRDCPTQNTKQGILWVGSAQAPKQPWIFLDVARLLPSEQFTMILPPGEIALFEHIRREAPGIPNLTLIDRQLPYLETQPYFDRAEVFMYTTAFGTDPAITVLQAALGGCAIVSSRLDPDENMFTKHDTGIVCNDSSAEIAEAISRLRLDEARKEELAHNAFQYVKDTYDIATMTKQYSGLIDSLF